MKHEEVHDHKHEEYEGQDEVNGKEAIDCGPTYDRAAPEQLEYLLAKDRNSCHERADDDNGPQGHLAVYERVAREAGAAKKEPHSDPNAPEGSTRQGRAVEEAADHVGLDAEEEDGCAVRMKATKHNTGIQLNANGGHARERALGGRAEPARQHEARDQLTPKAHARTEPQGLGRGQQRRRTLGSLRENLNGSKLSP